MKDQDKPKKPLSHGADQGGRVVEMGQQIADLQRQVRHLEEAHAQRVQAESQREAALEALRRRAEEMNALQATLLDITAERDLASLLETIVKRATRLLNGRGGGMYLCDAAQRQVRCVVSHNTPTDYFGTKLAYGEGAAGKVAKTGEALIVEDYRTWHGRATLFEEQQPFTSIVSAPMMWKGQVTGVIHVLDDVESRRFAQDDLELLTMFANHAAIAVENARLYEQAQREIAERTQTQAQLWASLAEKEVLLKEIHHRVKNNLQVISSLLNLQTQFTKDPQTLRVLRDSQQRVRSMAQIHQHLYRSQDLTRIDMEEYITGLASHLSQIYIVRGASFEITVSDVALTIDTAIPCGLIINELVSNALKYAFPENEGGKICVELRPGADGLLTLVVSDDGAGLPRDVDPHEPTSLGLMLVKMLSQQLRGRLEVDRESGTAFRIAFPA